MIFIEKNNQLFLTEYTNEKAKEWFGLPTADRNFSKYNGTSTPKERLNVVLANGTKIYSRLVSFETLKYSLFRSHFVNFLFNGGEFNGRINVHKSCCKILMKTLRIIFCLFLQFPVCNND